MTNFTIYPRTTLWHFSHIHATATESVDIYVIAYAISHWHIANVYCSSCGLKLIVSMNQFHTCR